MWTGGSEVTNPPLPSFVTRQSEPVSARVSSLVYFVTRMLRETHHAPVLENWGKLWIWHSVKIFLLCAVTNVLFLLGVKDRLPYLGLWCVGLVAWAFIFWNLRRRSGPVTFVERQIAHVWAGSSITSTLLYFVEWALDLPVLTLSPVLQLFVFAGTILGGVLLWRRHRRLGQVWLYVLVVPAVLVMIAGFQLHLLLPRSISFAALAPVLSFAAIVDWLVEDPPAVLGRLVPIPLAVAVLVYLPAAMVRLLQTDRVVAAFDVHANVDFIRTHLTRYSLGLLAIVLAGVVAQLGFFVFCVGIFPASFWSMCVMGYVVGELSKLDPGRSGGREAGQENLT